MKPTRTIETLSIACLLLAHGFAYAACFEVEPQDARRIPDYCKVRCFVSGDPANPEVKRWVDLLGENWKHMHHYCAAINFDSKSASSTDEKRKKFTQQQADNNYSYVLERWPANSRLYPEAHTRMGRLLERMGRGGEAPRHYDIALKSNPKYAPAYAAYADWYAKYGKKADAVEALKRGLQQVPNSGLLQRRLQRLGGSKA